MHPELIMEFFIAASFIGTLILLVAHVCQYVVESTPGRNMVSTLEGPIARDRSDEWASRHDTQTQYDQAA